MAVPSSLGYVHVLRLDGAGCLCLSGVQIRSGVGPRSGPRRCRLDEKPPEVKVTSL